MSLTRSTLSSHNNISGYNYNNPNINANINYSGARLMFIPTKNNIYTSNITKWQQHYGG